MHVIPYVDTKRSALFLQAVRFFPYLSGSLVIKRMKTIGEIRRLNLETLVGEASTLEALADGAGTSPIYLSQIRHQAVDSKTKKPREMGSPMARRLETSRGKDPGWMDREHIDESSAVASGATESMSATHGMLRAPRAVPVVGRCQGGFPARIWGDGDQPIGVTDDYAMVATTDDNAFVCQVVGSSMVSRYMPGEYALIEPNTTPEIEDDVLVRLHTGETMLKRLLSRRGGVRLGSYAEAEVFNYPERDITWMYYVAHPIPARRIKHRMEADQYSGEDRRHVERPQRARMVGELVGGMSYFGDLDDGTPPAEQSGRAAS